MVRYLLDTNILLRLSMRDTAGRLIRRAIHRLLADSAEFYYCSQNIIELWNVMTRPVDQNGFGLSVADAEAEVLLIERGFLRLREDDGIYDLWRQLVREYGVQGKQVHDARLVAAMRFHNIQNLVTLNRKDFSRYVGILVVDPTEMIKRP